MLSETFSVTDTDFVESSLNSYSCLPYTYLNYEGFFCPMTYGSVS